MWTTRENLNFIDYSSREFDSIKNALREYVEIYFPGEIRSFAPGTSSDIMLNLNAYVADVLHFYIDRQFSELFLDRAIELKNIYGISKGVLGYQPKGWRSAIAEINITVEFPDGLTGNLLDNYRFRIPKYSQFASKKSIFETQEDIDFDPTISNEPNVILTTVPTDTSVFVKMTKTNIKVVSGTTKAISTNIDNFDNFPVIIIPETNISQVVSVEDIDGNVYEDVKNLAQQAKFISVENNSDDSVDVPYVLAIKRVPYRYVKDILVNGQTRITFGNGDEFGTAESYVPTFSEFIDDNKVNGSFNNFNPEDITINNFTKTNTLGVKPKTRVEITYRVSGGLKDNVEAGEINIPRNLNILWYNPLGITNEDKLSISNSISCVNPSRAAGGREAEGATSIKLNASLNFAAQDRVVTLEDYYSRIMSLPSQYGKIEKLAIKKGYSKKDDLYRKLKEYVYNFIDFKSKNLSKIDEIQNIVDIYEQKENIDNYISTTAEVEENYIREITNVFENIDKELDDIVIYCLSMNQFGQLIKAPSSLKDNVITYLRRFTPVSTSIKIDDADIINFKVEFKVQIDTSIFEPKTVLLNCISVISDEFNVANMQIGKNIVRTKIYDLLHNIPGVVSVPTLEFLLLNGDINGREYSSDVILPNISKLYTYNGAVIQCPSNAIFEIKYPNFDVIGSTTK